MPNFNMGETLNIDNGGLFIKLKAKGDKVKFRLIKGGYYDGKHFIKKEDGWVVTPCPKIMNEEHCDYCEQYFTLRNEANAIEDKTAKEKKLKEADFYRVKMTFYYPIIDRDTGLGKILKTTLSVRQDLETEFKDGIDVYEYDYVLTRTEESPAKYYKLTRKDSKECIDLTSDEIKEMGKIGSMDLEEVVTGVKKSSQDFGQDEEIEDIIIPEEEGEEVKDEMPF